MQAFANAGYSAVSTRKLAAEAGVNIASLNYHFGGKRGLYEAVVRAWYDHVSSAALDMLPTLTGRSAEELCALVWTFAREHREAARLVMREVLDAERAELEEFRFQPWLSEWTERLAQGLGRDETQVRTTLVTIALLVGRLAVQDDESLMRAYGAKDVDDLNSILTRVLAATAAALWHGSD